MGLGTLVFVIGGVLGIPPAGIVKHEVRNGHSVFHCSATITQDAKIYTAGHCAKEKGKHEIILNDVRMEIEYANVDLKRDFAIATTIAPIRADTTKFMVADFGSVRTGDIVMLTGFGCYTKKQDMDFKYRSGLAKVIDITKNGFRTQGTVMSCPGDSGSAIIKDGKLVGIVSAVDFGSGTSYHSVP